MPTPAARHLLAIALLAALSHACSRGDAGAPGSETCRLLSAAEVDAVLEGRASAAQPEHLGSTPFAVDRCRWRTAERSLGLVVGRSPEGDAASVRATFESARTVARRDADVAATADVPGLGEAAWWQSHRLANELHVLSGTTSLTLTTRATPSDLPPAALVDAARAALGRLR
jgi:hypothetical protein